MVKKQRPVHHATDYDLDVTTGDTDMFRWFLLTYLIGKPIQSNIAVQTWRLFIASNLDTPWAIAETSRHKLIGLLYEGKYTRYAESTAHGLQECMRQLVRDYEGSLMLMYEYSEDEEQFSKRLQKFYGVGPKVAEIFMRETEELFARRVE
ncbi:DNA methylase [Candidatus Saccharibacteria bacterium]|nr:DNA methylase [Candidatus Saccharibacteria bacterium]